MELGERPKDQAENVSMIFDDFCWLTYIVLTCSYYEFSRQVNLLNRSDEILFLLSIYFLARCQLTFEIVLCHLVI